MRRDEMRDLYAACYPRLVQHVFAATGNLAAAPAAVNQAFVRALTQPASLRDTADPEAWIRDAAVRAATGQRRRLRLPGAARMRARTSRPRRPPAAPEPAPAIGVAAALPTLPADLRQVVILHQAAGLPVPIVAALTDRREADVDRLLDRADRLIDDAVPGRDELPADGWAEVRAALHAAMTTPDVTVIDARAQLRRRRRRAAMAGACVLLLGALSVPLLRGGQPPGQEPHAAARAAARFTGAQVIHQVSFSDRRHGFALASGCQDNPLYSSCSDTEILATHNAGRSWRLIAAPMLTPYRPYDIRALGPRAAVIVSGSGRPLYRTDDAGGSWHAIGASSLGRVSRVPDGWWLEISDAHLPPTHPGWQAFAVVDPITGRRATLSAYTGVARPTAVAQPVTGTIWIAGLNRRGWPRVAVSDDGGRDWRSMALPAHAPQDWVFFLDVHEPYALIGGWQRVDRRGAEAAEAVWLSSDHALHWTAKPTLIDSRERFDFPSCAVLTSGALVESLGAAGIRVSPDRGRTWLSAHQPVPTLVDMGRVAGTDMLYGIAYGGDFAISTDGGYSWQLRRVD